MILDDEPNLERELTLDDTKDQNLVPTRDTIRYGFLMTLLLLNNQPVLLAGGIGVGKSILVEDVLFQLSKDVGESYFIYFQLSTIFLPQ